MEYLDQIEALLLEVFILCPKEADPDSILNNSERGFPFHQIPISTGGSFVSVFGPHIVVPSAYSWLVLRDHSWEDSGSYVGSGIEPRLASCKESTIPTVLLL